MPAARYWRATGLQAYGGQALELSALHLYAGSGEAHRYWRLTNLKVTGSHLEVSELQMMKTGSRISGATLTASTAPMSGSPADLNDNNVSTRCYWAQSTAQASGFWLQFDFGTPVAADGIRQSGFDTGGRHLSGFTLSASNDGASWATAATFSGLDYPGDYAYSSIYAFALPTASHTRISVDATLSSTIAPTTGTLVALQDDDTATVCRWADVSAPGFALQWDFGGSPQDVSAVRLGGSALQDEFLECLTLQSSSDGLAWGGNGLSLGRFDWPGAGAMTIAGAAPLTRIVRPSTSKQVVLSGGMAGPAGPVLSPAVLALDQQDAGRYRIYGTVELAGTPNLLLRRRVQLWNQRDKRMVRETWSDATTGAWSFDYIRGGDGTRYCVVTYDHTGQKQAQIADNLEPEAM